MGSPACQNAYNHTAVCWLAPSNPVGEKTPGNVNPCGMMISPVKRYPLARTRRPRERTTENCANSSAAVTTSPMNNIVSTTATNGPRTASCTFENGSAARKATSTMTATTAAALTCPVLGGITDSSSGCSCAMLSPVYKPATRASILIRPAKMRMGGRAETSDGGLPGLASMPDLPGRTATAERLVQQCDQRVFIAGLVQEADSARSQCALACTLRRIRRHEYD